MKQLLLALLTFISLSLAARSQQLDTAFHLEIKQVILPGFHAYNFVVAGGKLRVYQNVYQKRHNKFQAKKIYTTNINVELENKIKTICSELYLLEDDYIKPMLDGCSWHVAIVMNNKSKKIYIDNYEVKEIDVLFSHINTLIKKSKPKLRLTK